MDSQILTVNHRTKLAIEASKISASDTVRAQNYDGGKLLEENAGSVTANVDCEVADNDDFIVSVSTEMNNVEVFSQQCSVNSDHNEKVNTSSPFNRHKVGTVVPKTGVEQLNNSTVQENKGLVFDQLEKSNSTKTTLGKNLNDAPVKKSVLYIKQTLRAGQVISHNGNLVIIGDINPGAEVLATGDITIWGDLKGIAHAGLAGNVTAEIRALKLDPIQIRIANLIARSPDKVNEVISNNNMVDKLFAKNQSPTNTLTRPKVSAGAELAKIVDGKIKISKTHLD